MGRTIVPWMPLANTTKWKSHKVCDGPTLGALLATNIADSEGVKPLPTICNRSESGDIFWKIGQYGDYRPLGRGVQDSKTPRPLTRWLGNG